MTEYIRGHKKLQLLRDLAEGNYTYEQLAEKYEKARPSIAGFAQRNKEVIAQMKADVKNEFIGLWSADKGNRIAEYESHIEWVNERLEAGEDNPKYARVAQTALRSIAEELGDLKTSVSVDPLTVTYKVEGVDPEAMK